ncbi:MAG TPA: aminopeptidase P N-terminal domain-containing protein, partial [Woeseiaceae bacterium]|nr:aminopeptidase P N-terminal domain-containing protein [Woeseiaceae bacterium]
MHKKEFSNRRKQIMRMIGEDAVAILPSAIISGRSRDVEYSYRQDSDFFYLTSFEEPNSLALFIPG